MIGESSVLLRESVRWSEYRSGGRRAQRHQYPRGDARGFGFQPRTAGGEFPRRRTLMDPAFAARFELKMLYGVRDIDFVACDSCVIERLVQNPSGRADERRSGEIFLVSGLLPDQHHLSGGGTYPEHRLRGVAIQVATAASLH
jgi:hypothetical protein